MPVTLTAPLLIAGVRASIQVYFAADKSLAREIRDRDLMFPDALGPLPANDFDKLIDARRETPEFDALITTNPDYQAQWDELNQPAGALEDEKRASLMRLFSVLLEKLKAPEEREQEFDQRLARQRIGQWMDDQDPYILEPWEEFSLDFGRVALEFIGSNPSVLQVGGNAERLIGSFATTANQIIVDLDTPGANTSKKQFGRQLLTGMLRAGLQTLSDERELIFDENHAAALVEATTKPVLDYLDSDDVSAGAKIDFERAALELIGPISQAAFGVVAEHQEAFLGADYKTSVLQGKLASALLTTVATDVNLVTILRKPDETSINAAGMRIFRALASVVADHPDLVINDIADDDEIGKLVRDVLQNTAISARDAENIDDALGLAIVAGGLEALSANTPGLINFGAKDDSGEAWESVAERTIKYVLDGFSESARNGNLNKTFTQGDLVALSRILFDQVAKTPQMVSGRNTEFEATVKAVANAMADKNNALMTSEDWLKIAAVAVREAGQNPGRLFGFDPDESSLGAQFLSEMMVAAADAMTLPKRGANVLFGETLRIAIETGLEAISADSVKGEAVLAEGDAIRKLADQISIVVAEHEGNLFKHGSREWLALWRRLLPELLAGAENFAVASVTLPSESANSPLKGSVSNEGSRRVSEILTSKAA